MGVGRFPSEVAGRGRFLSQNGWDWIVFLESWVGVGRFCRKMGGSG